MGEQYLTVGQLARKVGTTVRTLQYYDQVGLLSPSAKGPGNQRLYSHDDENELYRVFTLKYLGLSLAEIKERKELASDAGALRDVLSQTMASLEEDFQELVARLSVLRSLLDLTSHDDGVEWVVLAREIESGQGKGGYFWHNIADFDEAGLTEGADAPRTQERGIAVAKWHELVADAIALMSDHVTAQDPRAAEIAERYRALDETREGSLEQFFVLTENMAPHHGASSSFDVLRDSVVKFLDEAVAAHPPAGEGRDA